MAGGARGECEHEGRCGHQRGQEAPAAPEFWGLGPALPDDVCH